MNAVPKVTDIEEEENSLNNRIRLTKNEYYATIRNKLELNRFNVIRRHLEDENDLKACRIRSSIHEVRREALENKKVVCKIDEFVRRRNVSFHFCSSWNKIKRTKKINLDSFSFITKSNW